MTVHARNTTAAAPTLRLVKPTPAPVMCSEHRAYEADYCPVCGTAVVIGGTR